MSFPGGPVPPPQSPRKEDPVTAPTYRRKRYVSVTRRAVVVVSRGVRVESLTSGSGETDASSLRRGRGRLRRVLGGFPVGAGSRSDDSQCDPWTSWVYGRTVQLSCVSGLTPLLHRGDPTPDVRALRACHLSRQRPDEKTTTVSEGLGGGWTR